ncbi:hypothetical protein [Solemya elarraichensis gill symbiont]|uniref:Uncharacterized protein n=1 Tax=Solemya elarraichensis gill symbiont TaxID=1918949 RepID=A0A1T2LCJ9_9GAMM|nr:hypothetical protein [Solemya elarraichensis gill symbiont]OOZ42837.1 hypothetical protein BOW52_01220 [Solemya elarraichensis gill symbiont]
MNMRFISCQTLPDIAGARALYELDESVSDKQVAKIIFHHHTQEQGRDASFLAPFQAMLSVVAMFEIRDFETRLVVTHIADRSEMELLAALAPRLDGQLAQCWDDGHQLAALIKTRALVHAESLKDLQLQPIEQLLSLVPGDVGIEQMAGRLGITAHKTVSDESAWDIYRKEGITPLLDRCIDNLLATTLVGLRQMWLADLIDEDACDELSEACRLHANNHTGDTRD